MPVLIQHCAVFYPLSSRDVLKIKLMLVKLLKVCWTDWWRWGRDHALWLVLHELYILFFLIIII